MTKRLVTATINLDQYRKNLSAVRSMIGPSPAIMAVVKGNAYGHGIEEIAKTARAWGVDYLGVVSIGELEQIRQCGINTPCLILNYLDEPSIAQALKLDATVMAMDESFILAAQEAATVNNIVAKVHLKIDTGMHRAGCSLEDAARLARLIHESGNLFLEGVFTHFAESDSPDKSFTRRQLKVFQDCIKALSEQDIHPPLIHAANSGAIINLPESHFSMVRAGIISYGIRPSDNSSARSDIKPILQLHSQIVHLRQIARHEAVGYGGAWRADRDSIIGLVPIGYGDGFRRGPQHAKRVLVNGHIAPIIGAISMDQITIDVTEVPNVLVGDKVIIIGESQDIAISVADIANECDTISYEILTSLASRIERQYTQ